MSKGAVLRLLREPELTCFIRSLFAYCLDPSDSFPAIARPYLIHVH